VDDSFQELLAADADLTDPQLRAFLQRLIEAIAEQHSRLLQVLRRAP
jgi:spore coat protein CotF